MAFTLCALGWYGRSKGRVSPEMEALAVLVNELGNNPAYLPRTWCYPEKDHHVSPHRGCILR